MPKDEYARNMIFPAGDVRDSIFFVTDNETGVEQLLYVFTEWQKKTSTPLPARHEEKCDLVVMDRLLIDAVLFMY